VHIVALAAIHHVSPHALQLLITPGTTREEVADMARLKPFIEAHQRQFGWPDPAAIERFIERVERIAVR